MTRTVRQPVESGSFFGQIIKTSIWHPGALCVVDSFLYVIKHHNRYFSTTRRYSTTSQLALQKHDEDFLLRLCTTRFLVSLQSVIRNRIYQDRLRNVLLTEWWIDDFIPLTLYVYIFGALTFHIAFVSAHCNELDWLCCIEKILTN